MPINEVMNGKKLSRALFRYLNRLVVVPAFKMGLGRIFSNPLTGQVMVLKFRGRRTGKVYYAPVSYASIDGKIYCYQGKRLKGQWYLSLVANPKVEILLPHSHLSGSAKEVTDSREREEAMRQILKSSGLGSFIYGFNPSTASDKLIQERTRDIPVVRITPYEIQ
jgi:deazaflavin-dependent oxidoreductase (nitroreductase family)